MSQTRWILAVSIVIMLGACGGSEDPFEEGYSTTQGSAGGYTDLEGFELVDLTPLSFGTGSSKVDLKGNDGSSYLVVVTSANTTPTSHTIQLSDESLPPLSNLTQALFEEPVDPESSQFHQSLRELENVIQESGDYRPLKLSSLAALAKEKEVGDLETFKVLSTMTSLTKYEKVEAELRVKTPHLYFFVESDSEDQMNDKELTSLAQAFEEIILPRSHELFGQESDINGDGHISILMSCVTNRMSTSGGFVTGFFFPGDLYAVSSSNPASNAQEIFYTLVPDPEGRCGVPITATFATQNILPGVLGHELQHMISFNRHVFQNKGATEEPWLNEGLSHLAEDLLGYGQENPSRVKLFLEAPSTTSLIPPTSPRLAERGASYLFLRYLYEQHPDGKVFVQGLSEGDKHGVDNMVASFAGSDSSFDEFPEFIGRWAIAVALSNSGLSSAPQHNYRSRGVDPDTGHPTGILLRGEAKDGRGTVLSGPVFSGVSSFPIAANLNSSASQFFLIQEAPSNLSIQAAGAPTLTGAVIQLEEK